jgi:RimJ/RimL family protein N-acetyltransferase
MPTPTLFTSRLTLRSFRETDVETLHTVLNEPDILQYFPQPGPPPLDRVQRMVNHHIAHWEKYGYGLWAVESFIQGTFMGWCGLEYLPDTGETEVAYLLGHAWWGQGLATEGAQAALHYGFETIGLKKIIALVHPDNRASQRVALKLGMSYVERALYFGILLEKYAIENPTNL